MDKNRLGKSDLRVSKVGLGALHFGAYLSEYQSMELISYALDSGINLIDVGPLYGNGLAEAIVGKSLLGRRDKILLTTKVGLLRRKLNDGSFGVDVLSLTSKNITESLERSLKQLRTDYVDLFQLHAYDSSTPLEISLGVLNKLVIEGKIRAIGISNFSPEQLTEAVEIIKLNNWSPISSIETHFNMIERMAVKKLGPLCMENCIGMLPYRSLARGILSDKYKIGLPLPENSRAVDSWRVRDWLTHDTLSLVDALSKYSAGKNISITQLSIAWLLAHQFIPTVLIGARTTLQLQQNIESIGRKLTNEEILEIDQIIISMNQFDKVHSLPPVYFES